MKNKLQTSLLALALILTGLASGPKSHAGIRTIWGGGGYAEMQALSLWAEVPSWLANCAAVFDVCGQIAKLKVQNRALGFSPQARIETFTDEAAILPTDWLYLNESSPRSPDEIQNQILQLWLSQPELALSASETLKLTERLTSTLKVVRDEFELSEGTVEIHQRQPLQSEPSFAIFFKLKPQAQRETLDLTTTFTEQLPCRRGRAKLRSLEQIQPAGDSIGGLVSWSCDSEISRATFSFQPTATRLLVRLKSRVQKSRCQSDLESSQSGSL